VRDHWGVENRLHECLDVTMSEDSARNRMDSGPQNLAVLRHMALNVMRKEEAKISQRGKLKRLIPGSEVMQTDGAAAKVGGASK